MHPLQGRRDRRERGPHLIDAEEEEEGDEVDGLEDVGTAREDDEEKGCHHHQHPVGGEELGQGRRQGRADIHGKVGLRTGRGRAW